MKLISNIKFSTDLQLLKLDHANKPIYVEFHGNVSAGFPSPAEDFLQERISLDQLYLSKPESTFLTRIGGLSMFPDYQLNDIIINRSDYELQHGDDAVVSVNNSDFTLKRYNAETNTFYAINEDFKDAFKVTNDDVVVLLGVVDTIVRERKKKNNRKAF